MIPGARFSWFAPITLEEEVVVVEAEVAGGKQEL